MDNPITVVTPTIGDSAWRLDILLAELRKFTSTSFNQIVCDDGTISDQMVGKQKAVCDKYPGCRHVVNPGPVFGVSYNLNYAFEHVTTPWVYLIEDGLRPSYYWLDNALQVYANIANNKWNGREVGMIGFCHLQDWMLAVGGALHCDVVDVFSGLCVDDFYRMDNDGLWCWNRMLPHIIATCSGDTSRWHHDLCQFRDLIRDAGLKDPETGNPLHPQDVEQALLKWRKNDHWPARRTAWCGWYPGAFMLVNMDAWRKVGRWRDGCSFFEGHLGVRMGMNGYLSLCVEGPPWLHSPSLGFKASDLGKHPRIHHDTDELFRADFMGHDHMDAPNVLATGVVSQEEQNSINKQLAEVPLLLPDQWRIYQ